MLHFWDTLKKKGVHPFGKDALVSRNKHLARHCAKEKELPFELTSSLIADSKQALKSLFHLRFS